MVRMLFLPGRERKQGEVWDKVAWTWTRVSEVMMASACERGTWLTSFAEVKLKPGEEQLQESLFQ